MSTTYPMGGGYNCAVCGAFVPAGVTHSCAGFRPMPDYQVQWDRMSDVRIADALERIAAHLVDLTEIVHKVVEKLAAEEQNQERQPE